jgi:N6-adenosine-specific RNA methylase IME4
MPKFSVILADPPWRFAPMGIDPSVVADRYKGRSAESHYDTMGSQELTSLPVASIAGNPSVLFLWTTSPFLSHAICTMSAWGFRYKTVAFAWIKQNKAGTDWASGMGWYTLSNVELCILGTKGATLKRQCRNVRQLVVAPRREHSRKPDEVRARIERMYGPVPKVELFARERADGWTCLGNEVTGNDMAEDIMALAEERR